MKIIVMNKKLTNYNLVSEQNKINRLLKTMNINKHLIMTKAKIVTENMFINKSDNIL